MSLRILDQCAYMAREARQILNPERGMWANSQVLEVDPSISAYQLFDNFVAVSYGNVTSPWTLSVTNAATLVMGAAEDVGLGGVAILATGAATNDAGHMKVTTTDTAGGAFRIEADSGKKLWFETRLAGTAVAFTNLTAYVGLMDGACTVASAAGTGARNMTDGIYFRTLVATPSRIDWAFTGGSTEVVVKTDVGTLKGVATEEEYIRLGFYFDGRSSVVPYVNGTQLSNIANVSHTDFPNSVCLTPSISIRTATTAAKTLWIDYIKVIQQR